MTCERHTVKMLIGSLEEGLVFSKPSNSSVSYLISSSYGRSKERTVSLGLTWLSLPKCVRQNKHETHASPTPKPKRFLQFSFQMLVLQKQGTCKSFRLMPGKCHRLDVAFH